MFSAASQIRWIVMDPGLKGTFISATFECVDVTIRIIQLESQTGDFKANVFSMLEDLRLQSKKRNVWNDATVDLPMRMYFRGSLIRIIDVSVESRLYLHR
jgi:hypothetical protein